MPPPPPPPPQKQHGCTCGQAPTALAEASEQQGSFCLHTALCRPRQASSCCSTNIHVAHPLTPPAHASQVQVVLAVAKGVGRHLRFLEAVLHIRHMRYYIIFALVRGRLVLGDTRTDRHEPVTGVSAHQPA